jgi:hypothetical protein
VTFLRVTFAILAIIAIWLIFARYGGKKSWKKPNFLQDPWSKRWVQIGVGVLVINLILLQFPYTKETWSGLWKDYYLLMPTIFLGFFFGLLMLPEDSKQIRHQVAKVLLWTSCIALVWLVVASFHPSQYFQKVCIFGCTPVEARGVARDTNETITERNDESYLFPESLKGNLDAKVMYDFFSTELHPARDAFLMFTTCGKESSYHQFEGESTTPLHGKIDKDDTGICQINRRIWGKKAEELGFDIDTIDGNLEMALWIRNNEGIQSWKKMPEAKTATASISTDSFKAPTIEEGWTRTPVSLGFNIDSDGPIRIRTDNGRTFDYAPGKKLHLPDSQYIEYQSAAPADQPVTVYISRKK